MNVRVFRVLPCPVCKRSFGSTVEEAAAAMCCGRALPLEPMEVVEEADRPIVVPARE